MRGSLQELCAQARDAQNISMQQLIDETGIPEGTVKNFFASCSKNPSVYNAGLICSVLGISLDEYFGIEPVLTTEDKLAQANEQLKHQKQLHDADVRIAHLEGGMEQMSKTIDRQNQKEKRIKSALYGLMLLSAILMAIVAGYIAFDYRIPHEGLIQGGEASIFAWIVILLLAIGIGVIAAAFIMALQYSNQHAPLEEIRKH
nr:MAG TPA_asm: structural protein [Caudoviricetes sp.]